MSKFFKITWKILAVCAVAGLVLAAGGFVLGANTSFYVDSKGVHTYDERVSEQKSVKQELSAFTDIDADLKDGDINIIGSDRYYLEIFYYDDAPEFALDGQTLRIRQHSRPAANWHFFQIGGFTNIDPRLTVNVYIPQSKIGGVDVKSDFGEITASDVNAQTLSFRSNFGRIALDSCTAQDTTATASNGEVDIRTLNSGTLTCYSNFGSVNFAKCVVDDAYVDVKNGEIVLTGCALNKLTASSNFGSIRIGKLVSLDSSVTNNNGDIKISDSDLAKLTVKSNFGNIVVAGNLTGQTGIDCSNGDVFVETAQPEDFYKYGFTSSNGHVTVNGRKTGESAYGGNGIPLEIRSNFGNINVTFK